MLILQEKKLNSCMFLEREVQELIWTLSYDYGYLTNKFLEVEINHKELISQKCSFERISTNSYKLKGIVSRVSTFTGNFKVDLSVFLYSLVSALTGIEDPQTLLVECQEIESIIAPTIAQGMIEIVNEDITSEIYNHYQSLGKSHALIKQIREDELNLATSL